MLKKLLGLDIPLDEEIRWMVVQDGGVSFVMGVP